MICPICKQPVLINEKQDFVICCNEVLFVFNNTNDILIYKNKNVERKN